MVTEIQNLEQQLDQVRAELHAENQRGALKDSNKVAELEAKMSDLTQQLDVDRTFFLPATSATLIASYHPIVTGKQIGRAHV